MISRWRSASCCCHLMCSISRQLSGSGLGSGRSIDLLQCLANHLSHVQCIFLLEGFLGILRLLCSQTKLLVLIGALRWQESRTTMRIVVDLLSLAVVLVLEKQVVILSMNAGEDATDHLLVGVI